jgi:16S rRNA (adenine1518-N6/adenine1519-N6)-dimethyltransferase
VAVELDRRLLPLLGETLSGCDNVRIVSGDILKLDITRTVAEEMPGLRRAACANLPYNITSPAITALLEADCFERVTVMVQREVALRMCARPGTPDYGAFSVFVQYHSEPEILFDVPPGSFIPQPKVTSSVVTMNTRAEKEVPPGEKTMFFRVVRAAFARRRKTLVNSLEGAFGSALSKQALRELVTGCGFGELVRGETLGIQEFFQLSRAVGMRLNAEEGTK